MSVEYLITPDELAARAGEPGLRIFDCTTRLVADPVLYRRAEPCHAEYAAAHIPGAAYLDLQGQFSDTSSRWRFMMPSADDLAERFAAAGIGAGVRVVLYDTTNMMWSARFWWMLRAIGFDDVAVLDGGLRAWRAKGLAVAESDEAYPPAEPFRARPRADAFVDQDAVLAAMREPATSVLNALTAEQHSGDGLHYGRPGRITGSVCVPAELLTDPDSGKLKPLEDIRAMFAEAGIDPARPVLCYCGGGIAASLDAFALTLLGGEEISIYDASLSEWAQDPNLPMETD